MGRKWVSPDHERHELRRLLMGYYRREEDRYQIDVRQKLRNCWLEIEPEYRLDSTQVGRVLPAYRLLRYQSQLTEQAKDDDQSSRDLLRRWLLNETGGAQDPDAQIAANYLSQPSVRRYLDELSKYVAQLNLLWDGEVAGWACGFVHSDVTRQSYEMPADPAPMSESKLVHHLLTILAVPGYGAVALQKDYSPAGGNVGAPGWATAINRDPLDPYAFLKDLEQKAIKQVRDTFSEINASLKTSYEERNPSKITNARINVRVLYNHLRKGAELCPDVRKRIHHTAKVIEVSMLRKKGKKTRPKNI